MKNFNFLHPKVPEEKSRIWSWIRIRSAIRIRDPDRHQNITDPQHWRVAFIFLKENLFQNLFITLELLFQLHIANGSDGNSGYAELRRIRIRTRGLRSIQDPG
jgi:hypothetical protein